MSVREDYKPGAADVAQVEKNGDDWTLVLTKQLNHSPERVWNAITDPAQLHEWSPFDSDGNLGKTGAKVNLTTFGAPTTMVAETTVARAEPPRLLEFNWGGNEIRWELEPTEQGTRLRLFAKIDNRFIAMGAAGWHICFDVLDQLLSGHPLGRMAGMELMKFDGWQRLHAKYSQKFGVEMPKW